MNLTSGLTIRSASKCELCASTEQISAVIVAPKVGESGDEQIVVCHTCLEQIEDSEKINPAHWRCLNDSMWSPIPAVQVMAYRMLSKLDKEDWAQDLVSMMYMDEATTEWATTTIENSAKHLDCNGVVLNHGDTVVLIQDLDVKGANFIAKRGTSVRRISLVTDNPDQIQGKVNEQNIILLTKYVKKS